MAIPDEAVRYHVLAALRARGYRAENGDIAIVQQRIREEVAQATWTLAALEDIGDAEFPFDLLRRSLLHDLEQSQKRALLLLSFIYDSQMISQAQESFNRLSREKSAYAVEIIDMVVSPELKAVLLPLLEDTDRHEQLERLRVYFPQLRLNREERLKDIITSPQASHWSKACALYIVSEALLAGFADVVVAALVLQDSLVREMALWTLFKISPDVFRRSVGASGQSGDPALEKTATQTVRQIERVRRGEKMQLLTIEKVIVLKTVSIFIETPDALLAEIASILKEVEVHAGDHIIEKGDVGNCLYIIAEGEVVVHDGERTITHLGEREVVGELALLDSEPRTASVTAVENGLLLRLDQDAFYELIADYPDIVRGIMRVLARRLRAANQV
jgi:CRP-like cAMP-binding protein